MEDVMKTSYSTMIAAILFLFGSTAVNARCEIDVSDYVGWQIIYAGTVTGYIDDNGVEQDDFEGCEYGRELIVDYSKSVIVIRTLTILT
jgi:hypothetical protein